MMNAMRLFRSSINHLEKLSPVIDIQANCCSEWQSYIAEYP